MMPQWGPTTKLRRYPKWQVAKSRAEHGAHVPARWDLVMGREAVDNLENALVPISHL